MEFHVLGPVAVTDDGKTIPFVEHYPVVFKVVMVAIIYSDTIADVADGPVPLEGVVSTAIGECVSVAAVATSRVSLESVIVAAPDSSSEACEVKTIATIAVGRIASERVVTAAREIATIKSEAAAAVTFS